MKGKVESIQNSHTKSSIIIYLLVAFSNELFGRVFLGFRHFFFMIEVSSVSPLPRQINIGGIKIVLSATVDPKIVLSTAATKINKLT